MTLTEPGQYWAEQLLAWAIPDEILAQAEVMPWSHDPKTFAVDETLDPTSPIFELARELLPLEGGSVMDVGCGGGRSSLPLAPRATRIVGVDENPAMLARFGQAADEVGVEFTEIQGRFPDADKVLIDRAENRHSAFGLGIHRCLGSNLARLELTIAIEEFINRFPSFTLGGTEDDVTWSVGQIRGPRELPVRVLANK